VSDIDCNTDLAKYHGDHVTLLEPQRKKMRKHRDAGSERLDRGLDRDGNPRPYLKKVQGSYAMHTMHQDEENEYDIDQGIYFYPEDLQGDSGESLSPLEARTRIATALRDEKLKYRAEVKPNCVRQLYNAGYHIDMPVYRVTLATGDDENAKETIELAAGNEWVSSDARAVTRWFEDIRSDLNAQMIDKGAQMTRVVRLTKRFARSRTAWKNDTTSGICITKLVVDHFVGMNGRLDIALRRTWQAIDRALGNSTRIDHPVNPDARLAEEGDDEVEFFHSKLSWALDVLDKLDALDSTRTDARECWDEVFDTDFFSGRSDPDDKSGGGPVGGAPFVVTGKDESRRRTDEHFG